MGPDKSEEINLENRKLQFKEGDNWKTLRHNKKSYLTEIFLES